MWQIKGLRLFPEAKLPGEGGGLVIKAEHQPQKVLLRFLVI